MWTLPAPAELEQLLDKAADLPPALAGDLSAPLAMAMPPEWQESQHKILIVGQETLGWDYRWSADDWKSGLLDGAGRSDRAKALINAYEAFDLAASQPKSVRSPFWRAQRALADRFEGGDYRKVLWTNLSRCDNHYGRSWRCQRLENAELRRPRHHVPLAVAAASRGDRELRSQKSDLLHRPELRLPAGPHFQRSPIQACLRRCRGAGSCPHGFTRPAIAELPALPSRLSPEEKPPPLGSSVGLAFRMNVSRNLMARFPLRAHPPSPPARP